MSKSQPCTDVQMYLVGQKVGVVEQNVHDIGQKVHVFRKIKENKGIRWKIKELKIHY